MITTSITQSHQHTVPTATETQAREGVATGVAMTPANVRQALDANIDQTAVSADIRRFGTWSPAASASTNTATLIAAYDAMVNGEAGSVVIPPGQYTITAPSATRVATDEGACLIMDHTNGATIQFIGTPGATFINPASNKLEMFVKDGDFDFILDGITFDNRDNGILQLQVKRSTKTMNGGIAGLGNGANAVVRQYDGTGLVALRNVRAFSFNCVQDHIGQNGDITVLKGDIEQTNAEFDDICFGLLCQQPKTVTRNNVHGRNVVDSNNGYNTDGTETNPAIHREDGVDPGHTLYVTNRAGEQIEHQSHVNIKTTGAASSGEKIRKGQNITFSNYSFLDTGRGLEIFNNYRAAASNITGALAAGDPNQNAIELSDAGGCKLSNIVVDLRGLSAWGLRCRGEAATATITGITRASPAVVSAPSHGFVNGEKITFFEVVFDIGLGTGMKEINGLTGIVTRIDDNSFSVNIDSSGFTAYTSGGYATKTPWSNRHNFISNMTVIQPHITEAGVASNGKSAFFVEGQEDCVLHHPTQVHLGSAPGRAVVDLRNCKRVTVFMPKKIAPNAPNFADRLVVLDSNCRDCTVVYDGSCLSVPATANTISDNGVNTKIICLSGAQGKFSGRNGTAASPAFAFESDPDLGLFKAGTNILAVSAGGTEVGRWSGTGYNPPSDGGSALGTASLAFSRAHAQIMALADGVTAPNAQGSRAFIYVDSADGDLKVKFGDGHTVTLAADS